uniref:TSA: Wollemia nobilis Ref_Wollemi_Transcript_10665_1416 transcribed RNA sequence n=1 Tax=Wollemia nobilis TaxID=56998 RepID=A0A0C9RVM2_9CONI
MEEAAPRKVLVPIAFGNDEIDVVTLIDVFSFAGASVTVASVERDLQVECSSRVKLIADKFISECASCIFDLVVLPGGIPGSERLRDCEVLEKICRAQAEEGRLYGAVGAAPAVVLETWGLLKGRRATCHPSVMDQLSSAVPVESLVQVDGNVTTAQGPAVTLDFALCLAEQLYGKQFLEEELQKRMVAWGWKECEVRKEEYNADDWALAKSPQVLVPIANGSDEMEAVIPIDVLRRAKANVLVASVEDSLEIVAARGTKIVADKLMKDAFQSNYDLILLPGGLYGPERLRSSEQLVKLLKEQAESNKIYGGICLSAVMLDTEGLLKGKKATSYPKFTSKLSDQSAVNARVVIDGKVITSQGPGTALEFAMAIVEKVFGMEMMNIISKAMVFSLAD